jgi:predicted  nucleic acid-binding Zn-ribbon protein
MRYWSLCALLLAAPLLTDRAQADDAGAQKAMAKAQFMLRQVTAEKTALEQQVADLQKQVQGLTQQLGDVKKSATARQENLAQQLAGTSEKFRDANEKMGGELKDVRVALRDKTQHAAELEQRLQAQTDNFKLCYANNKKLFDLNRELLARYQEKGVVDAMKQKEPFTGIKEVEVENLVQDYQYQFDGLTINAPIEAAGSGK